VTDIAALHRGLLLLC